MDNEDLYVILDGIYPIELVTKEELDKIQKYFKFSVDCNVVKMNRWFSKDWVERLDNGEKIYSIKYIIETKEIEVELNNDEIFYLDCHYYIYDNLGSDSMVSVDVIAKDEIDAKAYGDEIAEKLSKYSEITDQIIDEEFNLKIWGR